MPEISPTKSEKLRRAHRFVHFLILRADLANFRVDRLAPRASVDFVFRQRWVENREIGQQTFGEGRLEETIDDRMFERAGAAECVRVLAAFSITDFETCITYEV